MSAHNDTAFLRMFLLILGALVAFTVVISIAAHLVTGAVNEERGEDPRLLAAITERIAPVGTVDVAEAGAAAAAAAPMSGEDLVASACGACHTAGVLGAPKIGDKAAWSERLQAQGGIDGLVSSAVAGKGSMPPKGGTMASDAELKGAIEYMLSKSGVDAGSAGGEQAAAAPAAAAPAAEPAAPVAAEVAPAATADVAGMDLEKGKSIYDSVCFVCHATGAAGAPKKGDTAAWQPRIAQGMDTLYGAALHGLNAMPPKGGRMDLSDDDVKAAVAYMVSESK